MTFPNGDGRVLFPLVSDILPWHILRETTRENKDYIMGGVASHDTGPYDTGPTGPYDTGPTASRDGCAHRVLFLGRVLSTRWCTLATCPAQEFRPIVCRRSWSTL